MINPTDNAPLDTTTPKRFKKEYRVETACNPERSIIVSACAGSGKTWLLVARMVRLLLAGVKPQEILALTFTRKAAQEMRARLYGLLEQFAISSDDDLIQELKDRGFSNDQAHANLYNARSLYQRILANPQPIVIETFHGWFGKLLAAAPVSVGIQSGCQLREDGKRLLEESLEDWWRDLQPELQSHYDVLLNHLGAHETQKFLTGKGSLFQQRGAWTFFIKGCAAAGISPSEKLKESLHHLDKPSPLLSPWQAAQTRADLSFLMECFANSTPTDQKKVPFIEELIRHHEQGGDIEQLAKTWQTYFLTKEGVPRTDNFTLSAPVKKYLATKGVEQEVLIQIRQEWVDAFLAYNHWQDERLIYALNRAWFALSESMLVHVKTSKETKRVRDFDDLEIGVSELMADSANAAYLQSRLDAKYKHILVDEFQDTNLLQWQILRSWLDGYGQDVQKPSVFIVGDPKQSIYRFRRADPRLFSAVEEFLHRELNAVSLEQNQTRRNAPEINAAVNRIFTGESVPIDYPFVEQTTAWTSPLINRPAEAYASVGEAYTLPLIARNEIALDPRVGNAFDQAIMDPSETTGVMQRYEEGKAVSQLIVHLMATRRVIDKIDGKESWRAARASDFLLLVKRRQYFAQYERALRDAGLAFESSRLGGLFNTLEVDDLLALLTTLVTPRHDLPLAQVLRSPLFGLTEAQMQQLSNAVTTGDCTSWWDALQDSPDIFLQKAARYLKHWQILGERLPVHDLLDRIYQESDIRIKYATVTPELTRPQVLANLDAFLELALKQDGGRYPSLSRFVEQMNTMRRGDDDETPNEGEVDAESYDHFLELDEDAQMSDEDRNKRVRLMTIHGAKGLEAPFVIVLDANHTDVKTDHSGVLMSWEPSAEGPSHLSLFTSQTLTSPRLEIDTAEKQISEKENWNLLYVAMTRARQGVWISGVAKKSSLKLPDGLDPLSWLGKATTAAVSMFPMVELVLSESLEQIKERVAANTREKTATQVMEEISSQQTPPTELASDFSLEDFVMDWQPALTSHAQLLREIEAGNTVQVFQDEEPSGLDQTHSDLLEEGVHFHKLLEYLTNQTGAHRSAQLMTVQELALWLNLEQHQAQKALDRASRVMSAEALKKYLHPGDWLQAWNEMDLVSTDGHRFRLDRLVEFDDHLAILDYKLTIPEKDTEQLLKYQAQLKNYQTELGRIRPDKPNKAYLVSATGQIQLIE